MPNCAERAHGTTTATGVTTDTDTDSMKPGIERTRRKQCLGAGMERTYASTLSSTHPILTLGHTVPSRSLIFNHRALLDVFTMRGSHKASALDIPADVLGWVEW